MKEHFTTSELMTAEEVAAYLGIAVRTVYRKVQQRAIPHIKAGGMLRFSRKQVDAWLEENTVQPQSAGTAP